MEGILFILIFIGVIAITALLFGVWVVVSIIRLVVRLLASMFAPAPRPQMPLARALPSLRCVNDRCHAVNPANARFCRRCGQTLDAGRVATSRAAVW